MIHKQPNPYSPNPNVKVWIDGQLFPADQAKISVWDHGLLYGDGIFEGIRVYRRNIFACEQHLERFFESAKALRLELPMTGEQIQSAMHETLAANHVEEGYIRLVATRGVGTLGLSTKFTANPSIIIIAATIALYPKELYDTGLSLISSTYVRSHPNSLSPRVKSLNYINNILAKTEAQLLGAHEAVMYNHLGHVAECSGDNLFVVSNGVLRTPDPSSGILAGITRDIVMQLALKRQIPVRECTLIRHDLYTADECFLTGTAAEIIAVTSIDGRKVGSGQPGEITCLLRRDYEAHRSG